MTPDIKRIEVFSRGIERGLNSLIILGGHIIPSSILGVKDAWKNIQKNDKKNKTSEVINKIIPIFRFLKVWAECRPWRVASRAISRHHM